MPDSSLRIAVQPNFSRRFRPGSLVCPRSLLLYVLAKLLFKLQTDSTHYPRPYPPVPSYGPSLASATNRDSQNAGALKSARSSETSASASSTGCPRVPATPRLAPGFEAWPAFLTWGIECGTLGSSASQEEGQEKEEEREGRGGSEGTRAGLWGGQGRCLAKARGRKVTEGGGGGSVPAWGWWR